MRKTQLRSARVRSSRAGGRTFWRATLSRDWSGRDPIHYPDPDVITLDKRFAKYKLTSAAIERVCTGMRWAEGPAWNGAGNYLMWSDIPNDRQMRWLEEDAHVGVFRHPCGNSNGNNSGGIYFFQDGGVNSVAKSNSVSGNDVGIWLDHSSATGNGKIQVASNSVTGNTGFAGILDQSSNGVLIQSNTVSSNNTFNGIALANASSASRGSNCGWKASRAIRHPLTFKCRSA